MASHNTKSGAAFHKTRPLVTTRKDTAAFHKTPPAKKTKEDTARFLSLTLSANELSIEDDSGIGGDPYNSTGQHVIVKQKKGIWRD